MLRASLILMVSILIFLCLLISYAWQEDKSIETLKTTWATSPSKFLVLNGQEVHYRDEGPRDDPNPIVLIHGASSSLHTWDGWFTPLSGQRRVITMDIPGFGITGPNAKGDYSIEAYVNWIEKFTDVLKIQRFVIGGYSLGGEIAWNFVLQKPNSVAGLILVDASGYAVKAKSFPIIFRAYRNPYLRPILEKVLIRPLVKSSLLNVFHDPKFVTDALVEQYFELALRPGNRRALGQRFAQTLPGLNSERIREIKVPTLILWGKNDNLTPVEMAEKFALDIQNSKLFVFDQTGHLPHVESTNDTLVRVNEFISSDAVSNKSTLASSSRMKM